MNRKQLLAVLLAMIGVAILNPVLATGKPCSVAFDQNVIQLGTSSDKLFDAKGPPTATFSRSGPSSWMLYQTNYEKGLKYGKSGYRDGNFMVFNNTYYYIDNSRTIVEFNHMVSNRPHRLRLLKDELPWVKNVKWEKVHFITNNPVDSLLASFECRDRRIMVHVDCYQIDDIDRKTYQKIVRKPKEISECKYRGLFIQAVNNSKLNTSVKYNEYEFPGAFKGTLITENNKELLIGKWGRNAECRKNLIEFTRDGKVLSQKRDRAGNLTLQKGYEPGTYRFKGDIVQFKIKANRKILEQENKYKIRKNRLTRENISSKITNASGIVISRKTSPEQRYIRCTRQ